MVTLLLKERVETTVKKSEEAISTLKFLEEIALRKELNSYLAELMYQLKLGHALNLNNSIPEALGYLGIKVIGRFEDEVVLADGINTATVKCKGFYPNTKYNFNTLKIE
ncbi:hypothetical protein [Clostridium magnum]|uniref:Uncharacterized protein n=2 Tax=Clostridium magnum TaxID=33954 RepID=A0A162QCK3_9CLOT|nr:hypothetical protein [Clostridium magnum]KZL88389.1 hypothetical protein CLMAG_63160 [Clostridium magnum DSM 2767]SHJ46804.1 hypothetical protein SAMN02745944_06017 [Clostridium magnum DSM 2767]